MHDAQQAQQESGVQKWFGAARWGSRLRSRIQTLYVAFGATLVQNAGRSAGNGSRGVVARVALGVVLV